MPRRASVCPPWWRRGSLVLFWLLSRPARRGGVRAARGGAARRGGCGGVAGVRYLGHSFYGASAPFWRQSAVTSELREWSRCGGMDSFIKAPRARVAGGADAQRRVPPEGLPGPSRARPRGHPRRRDEQAGAGLSGRRSFRCLGAGEGSGQRRNDVGEPAAAANTPPCQSVGTNQAEARKSASDRRCAYNTERAATTTTQKACRTQHNRQTCRASRAPAASE